MLRTVTAGPEDSPPRSGAAAPRSGRTPGGYGARPPAATDEFLDGSTGEPLDDSLNRSAAEPPDGSLDELTAEPFDESAAESLDSVPRGWGRARTAGGLGAGR
ncbi:hypothetical protein AB0M32_52025 [Streptomyces sp. NPDC051985]|uniref:hypothetical protein n=1 Tax=Streptomyces sp. NPDC051985 TaxID=3155807 RepID=UPI003415B08F